MSFFGRLYALLFLPEQAEPKKIKLPADLEPLPLEQVKILAKTVTAAREDCRTIMTAEGSKELPAEEYEKMLVEHWTTLSRRWVYKQVDAMLTGARKK